MAKYQFSLELLVNQTKEDAASEAAVAKARAILQAPEAVLDHFEDEEDDNDPQNEEIRYVHPKNHGTDFNQEHLLATVLDKQGEDGGLQKVKHAMRRTEALRRPRAWYFFSPVRSGTVRDEQPLPESSLASTGWQTALRGTTISRTFSRLACTHHSRQC